VASMKSDLRNLVTAQEAFFSDNNTYAGNIGANQVNNPAPGAGTVAFVQSAGNTNPAFGGVTSGGWNATITNPAVTGTPNTCGVFVGTAAPPGGMPAGSREGAPACW